MLLVGCGGETFHATGDAGSSGRNANGGATSDEGGVGANGGTTSDAMGGASGSGQAGAGGTSASGGKGGSGGASGAGGRGAGGHATGGAGGGTSCTSSNDCAANDVCGFPMQDGCTAKGICFPAPMAICNAYSPGCACDGSMISIACTGLPDGYVSKPLAHTGMCNTSTTFTCGTVQCNTTSEYCKVSEDGACCNPPSYACVAFPASCASTPTCACLKPSVAGGQCSESGGVTVTYAYP